MKEFQLVLQFKVDSIADFELITAFEGALIELLPASIEVDGHDCGAEEFNIFIMTDEPEEALAFAETIRLSSTTVQKPIAAYRPVSGEKYVVLWPHDYQGFLIS